MMTKSVEEAPVGFELRVSDDDSDVAYLRLPSHPGVSPCRMSRSVRLGDIMGDYEGPDVVLDFVTHGDANSAWVLQDGEWAAMSHRTVARAITGDAAYAGGPVRLIACQSGACATGFARNLSNSLGVPVLAPMGSPIVEAGGAVTGGGAWRLFLPGSPFH